MENAALLHQDVTNYKIDDHCYYSESVKKLRPGDLIMAGDAERMGGILSQTLWLPSIYCVVEVDVQVPWEKGSSHLVPGIVLCVPFGTRESVPSRHDYVNDKPKLGGRRLRFSGTITQKIFTWKYATQAERHKFITQLVQHAAYPFMHGFLAPTAIVETTKKWVEDVKPQAEKCLLAISKLESENSVIIRTAIAKK